MLATQTAVHSGSRSLNGAERATIRVIGVCYLAVAVLAFLTSSNMLLGMIHINQADRWLHVFLASGILATGFGLSEGPAGRA